DRAGRGRHPGHPQPGEDRGDRGERPAAARPARRVWRHRRLPRVLLRCDGRVGGPAPALRVPRRVRRALAAAPRRRRGGGRAMTGTSATVAAPVAAGSTWAPLRIAVFRAAWIAALLSNLGSWMHIVAAAWL